MGLRETLNEKPVITTVATAVILVISAIIITFQLIGTGPSRSQAYYTVDDGKTTFADDLSRIPPFEYHGKQAVRAMVFSCDGGRTRFVAWLERYTPDARKRLEAARKPGPEADNNINDIELTGKQVKPPNTPDSEWTTQENADKFNAIITAKCPDGKTDNLMQMLP